MSYIYEWYIVLFFMLQIFIEVAIYSIFFGLRSVQVDMCPSPRLQHPGPGAGHIWLLSNWNVAIPAEMCYACKIQSRFQRQYKKQ